MDRHRRKLVEEIFQAALDLPEEGRRGFVEETAPDSELCGEVLELLQHHDPGSAVFRFPSAAVEPPPEAIGPYRILSVLGEGGMGTVYLTEQTDPIERQVALKLIKPGMDSAQVLARFQAERQVLAILDHPNIARIYEAGTTEQGRPWFAMEYAAGVPVTEWCDAHRLDPRARIEVFLQVCAAIQYAHQKGVIHRDIKPGNILVDGEPGDPSLKVIDFGIAKAVEGALTRGGAPTQAGQLLGTPEYMSPEQAAMQDVDTRTDVYALGLLLYELLVGSPPFDAVRLREGGFEAMLRIIREDDPPLPSSRAATLGATEGLVAARRSTKPGTLSRLLRGDLDWILVRALEKDRERRYDSPAALADDLRRHQRNEPVQARPPSRSYRARKFLRRHRLGATVGAVLALSLVLVAAVSLLQSRRVAEQRDRAEHEAAVSREVAGFLGDLFHEASFGRSGAQDLTLRGSIDLGVGNLEREPGTALSEEARLRILRILSGAYTNLGSAAQARPLLESAMDLALHRYGEGHLETAQLRYQLGTNQRFSHEMDAAAENFRRAWKIFSEQLGPDDPQTLRCRWQLASALSQLGGRMEAVEHFEALLEAYRRVYGPAAAKTAMMCGELAAAYGDLCRLDEAIALDEEGLAILERKYGQASAMTMLALTGLFSRYRLAERYEDARLVLARMEGIVAASFGPEHAEMGTVHLAAAQLAVDQGDPAKAAREFREALPSFRASGQDGNAGECLLGLAEASRRSGDLQGAAAWLSALDELLATDPFEPDHLLYARRAQERGELERVREHYEPAELLTNEAVERFRAKLPPQHVGIASARLSWARCLLDMGKDVAALEVLERARHDVAGTKGSTRITSAIDSLQESIRGKPETGG